jgi:tetratricopeptide (TPR) repeat protein
MRISKLLKIVLLSFAILGMSQSAVFNRVNTVINTPAARMGSIGVFEFGFSFAPFTSSGAASWEEDYYLNYFLTDFLALGVTRINNLDYVGNFQLMVAKDLVVPNFNLAVGVENLYGKTMSSTFDGLDEKYVNNTSIYTVGTYYMDQWEMSLGFGDGRLSNEYNDYVFMLSNMFYSATYFFSKEGKNSGRFSFEYDSKDFNIGLIYPLSDKLELQMALTQLPLKTGENNAAYGDVPVEYFTVGITFRQDFFSFYGDEYTKLSKKIKEVDEKSGVVSEKYKSTLDNAEAASLIVKKLKVEKEKLNKELTEMLEELKKEKNNLKNEVKALRDVIASEGFKKVKTVKEDIMQHYYQGLRYYYDEKYFKAIEELTKAIIINDNIPELHIRLGSIYWSLELKSEALESWQRAYAIDKQNSEFNEFLIEKKIDYKKWR